MPRHIILMPNWIGDFLIALAVVMRRKAEDEHTTLLVPEYLADLCRKMTDLPLIPYARKTKKDYKRTISIIRRRQFDCITLLPHSFSSARLAFHSRIPKRVGLNTEFRGFFLTQRLPAALRTKSKHILSMYAHLLSTSVWSPEQWDGAGIANVPQKKYKDTVVLCPGAMYGPAKRWPYFSHLAEKLDQRIVVIGTADDWEEGERIKNTAPERVQNLCGKTTLIEAAEIISSANVVISNDSGLMHMAGFLGTRVIGIFGSTSPVWTHPLGNNSVAIQQKQPCAPCFARKCKFGHYKCLREISVDEVLKKIKSE